MADWIAYYRTADGVLVGCGIVPPPTVPPELSTRNYGAVRPDEGLVRWDTTTRDFVAVPPEVLIDRL